MAKGVFFTSSSRGSTAGRSPSPVPLKGSTMGSLSSTRSTKAMAEMRLTKSMTNAKPMKPGRCSVRDCVSSTMHLVAQVSREAAAVAGGPGGRKEAPSTAAQASALTTQAPAMPRMARVLNTAMRCWPAL